MARSPYKQWSPSFVATGTTLNIAANRMYPIGPRWLSCRYNIQLLLYPTWALSIYIPASKPRTQLAISRHPSDIAIQTDYLAFWPKTRSLSLDLARHTMVVIVAAHISFHRSHAKFPFLHWHRVCIRGALGLRSRLFCPRARMTDVALLRIRIKATVQAS
eukprot:6189786-Pleurochrysis_carterae.AAC.5